MHGKKEVAIALLKFCGVKYDSSNSYFKNINYQLCYNAFGFIHGFVDLRLNIEKNDYVVKFFKAIFYSLKYFQPQYTKESDIIEFLSKIIVDILNKKYFYVWFGESIEKYVIDSSEKHFRPIETYNIECVDNDRFIKIKGTNLKIPIKGFIKKPSRKDKTNNRNNDYQRYFVFYNFVDNILSDKNGPYCPYCNPYGRKEKSKKTGKDKVSKGCIKCNPIFNKVYSAFKEEGSSRRFLDNLRKDITKEVSSKKEFYAKRLRDLDKTFKKELIRNGYINRQNYKEITEYDLRLIPKNVLAIKYDFEKRFTIED